GVQIAHAGRVAAPDAAPSRLGGVYRSGTQAQTSGELSNRDVVVHRTVWMHWQMPPQSAPPVAGSQLSAGLSTHLPPPGHLMPAMPPQLTGFLSGTQAATGGHG